MRVLETFAKREPVTMYSDFKVKDKFVYVMGGGKFGTKALRYLRNEGAKVLVADMNPKCIARTEIDTDTTTIEVKDSLKNGEAALLVGDAIDYLLDILETDVPDWIVTAIPCNAIAKIVESWFSKVGYKLEPYQEIIREVVKNIPESLVSVKI